MAKRWGAYDNLECGITPVTNYRGERPASTVCHESDYVEPLFVPLIVALLSKGSTWGSLESSAIL